MKYSHDRIPIPLNYSVFGQWWVHQVDFMFQEGGRGWWVTPISANNKNCNTVTVGELTHQGLFVYLTSQVNMFLLLLRQYSSLMTGQHSWDMESLILPQPLRPSRLFIITFHQVSFVIKSPFPSLACHWLTLEASYVGKTTNAYVIMSWRSHDCQA